MKINCPSCGGTSEAKRLNTILKCPFCNNTLYPTSSGTTVEVFSHHRVREGDIRTLNTFIRSRGYRALHLRINSWDNIILPLRIDQGVENLKPEACALPSGFIPFLTQLEAADPDSTPGFELLKTGGQIIMYPFTSVSARYRDRSVSLLVDGVSGRVYSDDFPDMAQRRRYKRYRMVLAISITTAFIISALPLSPLLMTSLLGVLILFVSSYLGEI